VTPIFTRKNAEPYQQAALQSLVANIDRAQKN